MAELILGDCLEKMRQIKSESIDSLVTDPPAGIGFMGKNWDSDKGGRDHWIKWMNLII
jgi:site-specific DNA-methyltransferase (adenine-specific)